MSEDSSSESFNMESMVVYRKLQSKVEALNIMKSELEKYRTERDQFKLMAETLQMRYSAMKNSLTQEVNGVDYSGGSSVRALLTETRQKNIALQTEVDTLRQRLAELEGDIRVVRSKNHELQEISRTSQKVQSKETKENPWNEEKSTLIAQMETLKKQNAQLKYDIKSVLDEKEEIVTERDAYKCKAHRLNHELNVALKNDAPGAKLLDMDSLVLENKLLQEKLTNLEQEMELLRASEGRLRTQLEQKRKRGIMKFATNKDPASSVIPQIESQKDTPESVEQMKQTCLTLMDNLSDKSLALTHQKKANKLLATKIADLEQRLVGTGKPLESLSPSVILLEGYTSAKVDDGDSSFRRYDDDPITLSPAASSSAAKVSSGSNRSVTLSEGSQGSRGTNVRSEFSDLPQDLMEMVQKALDETDDHI